MATTELTLTGTKWGIDAAHSSVEFAVKHMMLATVRGRFTELAGDVAFEGEDFTSGRVRVVIDAASIDTKVGQRDEHLRSADFFDAASHPQLTFVSNTIERAGEDRYRVAGELTIRGATRPVVLDAEYSGTGIDPWGGTRIAFTASTRIDRREFGLTWNQALEAGGILVGDEIRITIDVQLVRQ